MRYINRLFSDLLTYCITECCEVFMLMIYYVQDRDEAKRQLTAHQKIIEKHKEMIQKCINFTKMLLVEKVIINSYSIYCICLLPKFKVLQLFCKLIHRLCTYYLSNTKDAF